MRSAINPIQRTGTFRSHYLVVDNFLPLEIAEAMRQDIDSHFAKPNTHSPATHQVWNYWFVESLYAYLRTTPDKVIREELVQRFMSTLSAWSINTLGMKGVSYPYLSLYVSGCRQSLHNDAKNGRFAFVYSLTRNERKTLGGETIVLHEGDLFRSKLVAPAAGRGFYTEVEPKFNRLVIFDDRIPHGVERVEGSMDPVEGRVVLHGHISEAGSIIEGVLPASTVNRIIVEATKASFSMRAPHMGQYHGPLVVRLTIEESGEVKSCDVLVDRVIGIAREDSTRAGFIGSLVADLKALKFPRSDGITKVIQPILFGGPLR